MGGGVVELRLGGLVLGNVGQRDHCAPLFHGEGFDRATPPALAVAIVNRCGSRLPRQHRLDPLRREFALHIAGHISRGSKRLRQVIAGSGGPAPVAFTSTCIDPANVPGDNVPVAVDHCHGNRQRVDNRSTQTLALVELRFRDRDFRNVSCNA